MMENRPVQRAMSEESIWHKWVKGNRVTRSMHGTDSKIKMNMLLTFSYTAHVNYFQIITVFLRFYLFIFFFHKNVRAL